VWREELEVDACVEESPDRVKVARSVYIRDVFLCITKLSPICDSNFTPCFFPTAISLCSYVRTTRYRISSWGTKYFECTRQQVLRDRVDRTTDDANAVDLLVGN